MYDQKADSGDFKMYPQILFFLMPGSKYIILVVLLINERNKERKKERGREEEGREKEEGEGRKVKKKK